MAYRQMAAAALVLSFVLAVPARAEQPPVVGAKGAIQLFPLSACVIPQMTMRLCGRTVHITVPNNVLYMHRATMSMPAPFVPDPYTIECMVRDGESHPRLVMNTTTVTCQVLECPAATETICGYKMPVPAGTMLGDTIDVPVDRALLANTTMSRNVTFQEKCAYQNFRAVYQLENASQVSCNLFPCPDAEVRLCDTQIPVKGGAPLGQVSSMTMPAPFVPDTFAVQCLGNGHNPPEYKIIDAAGVTCGVRK